MSEIWFKFEFDRIKKAHIKRSTDKMVVLENGRREAKVSDYYFYTKNFDEVKKHVLNDYIFKRNKALSQVDKYNESIAIIEKLTEDDIK